MKLAMSNLASFWRVRSQINLVLRELKRRRVDDIQVPKASMSMLIARTVAAAPEARQCYRPEHHPRASSLGKHSVGGKEVGKVRSINYIKKRSQHRAL